ncbi:hypothetical protein Y697_05935 [Mesotoga sp. BH458_6_3_2_1]|nr:hypothetical protein Y697_05935 [Mesotoga sp. BH458_6_3_2_1]
MKIFPREAGLATWRDLRQPCVPARSLPALRLISFMGMRLMFYSSLTSASDLSKDGSMVLDEGPRTFLYGDQRFLSKRLFLLDAVGTGQRQQTDSPLSILS